MIPTMDWDTKVLERKIQGLSNVLRKEPAEIVRRVARQWVELCIRLTPPTGKNPFGEGTKAAYDAGRNAIDSDLKRLFWSPEDISILGSSGSPATDTGKSFWKAVRKGQTDAALEIVKRAGLQFGSVARHVDPSIHKAARTSRGRVRRRVLAHLVTGAGQIPSYIGKVEKRIGYARSGWKDAATALKARSRHFPAWASRHNGSGSYKARLTGFHPFVTFINSVAFIQRAGRQLRIMARTKARLIKNLDAEISKLAGRVRQTWKRK